MRTYVDSYQVLIQAGNVIRCNNERQFLHCLAELRFVFDNKLNCETNFTKEVLKEYQRLLNEGSMAEGSMTEGSMTVYFWLTRGCLNYTLNINDIVWAEKQFWNFSELRHCWKDRYTYLGTRYTKHSYGKSLKIAKMADLCEMEIWAKDYLVKEGIASQYTFKKNLVGNIGRLEVQNLTVLTPSSLSNLIETTRKLQIALNGFINETFPRFECFIKTCPVLNDETLPSLIPDEPLFSTLISEIQDNGIYNDVSIIYKYKENLSSYVLNVIMLLDKTEMIEYLAVENCLEQILAKYSQQGVKIAWWTVDGIKEY